MLIWKVDGKMGVVRPFFSPTCILLSLASDHCNFFHFICMTYYVLKCSKKANFDRFLVYKSLFYKPMLSIFNTKQREIFIPSFAFLALSTHRRTLLDRLRILPGPRIYIHVGVLGDYFNMLQTE